jgi:hypothetical protein
MTGVERPVAPGMVAFKKLVAHDMLDAANAAFNIVNGAINDRACSAKPKKLNYEVFHEQTVARLAFLKHIAEATDLSVAIEQAKAIALNAVGLGETAKVADVQ